MLKRLSPSHVHVCFSVLAEKCPLICAEFPVWARKVLDIRILFIFWYFNNWRNAKCAACDHIFAGCSFGFATFSQQCIGSFELCVYTQELPQYFFPDFLLPIMILVVYNLCFRFAFSLFISIKLFFFILDFVQYATVALEMRKIEKRFAMINIWKLYISIGCFTLVKIVVFLGKIWCIVY